MLRAVLSMQLEKGGIVLKGRGGPARDGATGGVAKRDHEVRDGRLRKLVSAFCATSGAASCVRATLSCNRQGTEAQTSPGIQIDRQKAEALEAELAEKARKRAEKKMEASELSAQKKQTLAEAKQNYAQGKRNELSVGESQALGSGNGMSASSSSAGKAASDNEEDLDDVEGLTDEEDADDADLAAASAIADHLENAE